MTVRLSWLVGVEFYPPGQRPPWPTGARQMCVAFRESSGTEQSHHRACWGSFASALVGIEQQTMQLMIIINWQFIDFTDTLLWPKIRVDQRIVTDIEYRSRRHH